MIHNSRTMHTKLPRLISPGGTRGYGSAWVYEEEEKRDGRKEAKRVGAKEERSVWMCESNGRSGEGKQVPSPPWLPSYGTAWRCSGAKAGDSLGAAEESSHAPAERRPPDRDPRPRGLPFIVTSKPAEQVLVPFFVVAVARPFPS